MNIEMNNSLPIHDNVLKHLAGNLEKLTPELRKAANYILDNPRDVGIYSVRKIAKSADVKPNTVVRMAKAIGFSGYDDFKKPFQDQLLNLQHSFTDQARWLQSLSHRGKHGKLYAEMAHAAMDNLRTFYTSVPVNEIKAAADAIIKARRSYILGVGLYFSSACTFAYLANMAIDSVSAIPKAGNIPADDLAHAKKRDVLLAISFKPYRVEIVNAVEMALERGMKVIGVSDSLASPVVAKSQYQFVLPTNSPQFFTTSLTVTTFLETLMAFVIANSSKEAISNVERYHGERTALGVYIEDM